MDDSIAFQLSELAREHPRGDSRETAVELDWTRTALETIARASRESGVDPVPIDMVTALVRREIDAGHGAEDFNRIIEQLRLRA